jgi:hypothetical protein
MPTESKVVITSTWDKESVYDELIAPLVRRIAEICVEQQIPMVTLVQYSSDAARSESSHGTTIVMPPGCYDPYMGFIANVADAEGREELRSVLLEGGVIRIGAASPASPRSDARGD